MIYLLLYSANKLFFLYSAAASGAVSATGASTTSSATGAGWFSATTDTGTFTSTSLWKWIVASEVPTLQALQPQLQCLQNRKLHQLQKP